MTTPQKLSKERLNKIKEVVSENNKTTTALYEPERTYVKIAFEFGIEHGYHKGIRECIEFMASEEANDYGSALQFSRMLREKFGVK